MSNPASLSDFPDPEKQASVPLQPLDSEEIGRLRAKHYNATITKRIDQHYGLSRFHIKPDDGFTPFEPGQYVALGLGNWEARIPGSQPEPLAEKKRDKLVRRAYSISCPMISESGELLSVNHIDYLEFYITLVRHGEGPDAAAPGLTPRLFLLGEGDRIHLPKKIVGTYVLPPMQPHDTVLMISTGTGEAPHNAMAAELLSRNHTGKVINITCGRNSLDLAYVPTHRRLEAAYSNYLYFAFTTREPENLDPAHPGYVGKQYPQDLFSSGELASMVDDPLSPSNTHVFLCGNPAMIGYVPPSGDPPSRPGMLPILRDAGFTDDDSHDGAGVVRFEKYW